MTALLLLLAAQAIDPPLIGCLHESPAVMRCIYGVGGAFILGPAQATDLKRPPLSYNATLADGTRLSLESEEMVAVRPDGRIDRIAVPSGAEGIEPLGNGWFHLAGKRRLVRVTAAGIEIFLLPREPKR